jgi:heme/copper-type cytochrome/quinol oxidase subunit 3
VNEIVERDLSGLPLHGEGSASLSWWGNLAYMLIEGTGFALVIAMYFYLQSVAPRWPLDAAPPDLLAGTTMAALLLLSLVPTVFVLRWARAKQLLRVRLGVAGMTLVAAAALVVRVFEFRSLNVSWDSNAYGSVVWLLLGLHTAHLLTDAVEWAVLAAVMFSRHGANKRRFGDVEDNVVYWSFVVVTWLVVYVCLYWAPRT